jgi:GDPmannose 4,6-dehydratase
MMLQSETPDDYILATGVTHSIRDFLDLAFRHVGLDWKEWVEIDSALLRPVEVGLLVGDSSKARKALGWTNHVTFAELVKMMVDAHQAISDTGSPSPPPC